MKSLKNFLKENRNFIINKVQAADQVVEKVVKDVEIEERRFKSIVTVEIFDSSDTTKNPVTVRRVNATGLGRSIKEAERSALAECLFLLGY